MERVLLSVSALALGTGSALAGGLDRATLATGVLFETGNYLEFSLANTDPTLEGRDLLGNSISDIASDYTSVGLALKMDINEKLSFGLIYDQPYGVDVRYGGSNATTLLGGTFADADSDAATMLLRYKFDDNISIFGGARYVKADGSIGLSGRAYGAPGVFLPASANGYRADFASDSGWGYVVGAAYEIPDIAFRAAVTYQSKIDLELSTRETQNGFALGPSGTTDSELPQSISLDVQSGIAEDTLLFGSVRFAEWSEFSLRPPILRANLAEMEDVTTWTLGIGRRFNEKFSGTASVSYEGEGTDDLVSPLAPTNGMTALSLGVRYDVSDKMTVSGGIRYTWLGDARPETGTPDTARGSFDDNDAVSIGIRVGYHF